jgi:aminomuconate-semialdehyde/2-hydroxymuconate-6-semialdehyde dehydrogenase
MDRIANYINGRLLPPCSPQYLDNFDPSTGQVYSYTPDSDPEDVQEAFKAAQAVFPQWSESSLEQRSRLLMAIAQEIEAQQEQFALAESKDNGKPLHIARTIDIPRAIANFRFFASTLLSFASESHSMGERAINYTLRQPLGTVACISPWNLPLYLLTWKIAPALAMGNCVIAKPSEVTPMTAYLLSQVCIKVGLPAGVLNIIHGLGPKVGAALSSHPGIPAISFTGGTQTGAEIARIAAPLFKKLSLELGGKNPTLIFADCSYSKMLETTLRSSFANQGQICLCGSRIYVERPLYQRFLEDFVAGTQKLKVGDPLLEETQQGAIVSQAHLQKILSYLQLAKAEGATLLCGGTQIQVPGRCNKGWFVQPTILTQLSSSCRINQEEIFGPVVTVQPFDHEEEALEKANATPYGLASTLWTQNLSRSHRLSYRLKFGINWINCWMLRDLRTPFGGMKNSGVGREGGLEAFRFFTEPKNVCIEMD